MKIVVIDDGRELSKELVKFLREDGLDVELSKAGPVLAFDGRLNDVKQFIDAMDFFTPTKGKRRRDMKRLRRM